MPRKSPERIALAQPLMVKGDYLEARKVARSALNDPEAAEDEKDQLKAILSMTGADPAAIAVFGFTLAVLVFLVVRFVL